MGNAVVPARPKEFELKLRASCARPRSQFIGCLSQETSALDFGEISALSGPAQPLHMTQRDHATHAPCAAPFLDTIFLVGSAHLGSSTRQLRCFAKPRPAAACTRSCCPAQPLRKQPEEFGATFGYSGSHSAKDDSLESEGSLRKARCSSVGLGALIFPRVIFSLKAYF